MTAHELWARYRSYLQVHTGTGITVDISRMNFQDPLLDTLEAPMHEAIKTMQALEAGTIANPDEGRMVGHYWLRARTGALP